MKNSFHQPMFASTLITIALTTSGAVDAVQTIDEGPSYWLQSGRAAYETIEKQRPNDGFAKNVILFVGDGMGISTITAARILEGQGKPGNRGGEENSLSFEQLPYLALSKVYSANQQTPDSAATMTAMITGIKTNGGVLSIDKWVSRQEKNASLIEAHALTTLIEQAEDKGLSTGIVTTTRLTHATPAACYAHIAERDWESDANIPAGSKNFDIVKDIARQLIEFNHGNGLEVALGGGRAMFLPESVSDPEDGTQKGSRKDGRDLTQSWLEKYPKSAYIHDKQGFDAIDPHKIDHLLGLFNRSHMNYEHDRTNDKGGEPSLTEMTEKAIDILSKNPKGYVLVVEAGLIDQAHHAGNAYRALTDTIELSNAVRKAMNKTSAKDTLLVVTADHSHTLTIAGQPTRGNPILGLIKYPDETEFAKDNHGKPYTALSYANGPGYRQSGERPQLIESETKHPDYHQEALIPLQKGTHSAEDVAIFAGGPKAHLFRGVQEQSYIYQVLARALRIKPNK